MAHLPFPNRPARHRSRELLLAGLFVCAILAFVGRLVQLQVVEHAKWKSLAERQMYNTAHEPMPRGEIRDRNGLPLAVTLPLTYAVGFRPQNSMDRDSLATILTNYLPLSEIAIRQKLDSKGYTYLARRVDWQIQQQLETLNLPGIEFVREARRSYPATIAAGTAVGYTNFDGVGQGGIELALDSLLSGDKHDVLVWNDARRAVPAVMSPTEEGLDHTGANVYLTIDLQLQAILDRCMVDGLADKRFEKACAVLLDPQSCEVLGISTLPQFDPNSLIESEKENWDCWPVTDLFEPGSIFKVVTVSAGLEEGVVTPGTLIDCEGGKYRVPGKTLNDVHAYNTLTVAEIFAKSSNIGCAKIAERMRAEDVYSWITRFGFGAKTDIGLQYEPSGYVPKPAHWSGPTRSNLAIGHGVSVTVMQLAAAYAAIANGGLLMQPKLIHALEFPDGEHVKFDPVAMRPIMIPQHTSELTRMMTQVVDSGTGKAARVKGVKIAGKTGTAQKVNHAEKAYYSDRYVSSFAGFFPADNPQYVLIVVVDDPRGAGYFGGQISAPVFASIAREILEERHPEMLPEEEPANEQPADSLKSESAEDSIETPSFTYDTLKYADVPRVRMPDLIGLPLRAAARQMEYAGLTLDLIGVGVVVSQFPQSGEMVPLGYACRVIAEPQGTAQYAVSN